jgi:hypothetical protein
MGPGGFGGDNVVLGIWVRAVTGVGRGLIPLALSLVSLTMIWSPRCSPKEETANSGINVNGRGGYPVLTA